MTTHRDRSEGYRLLLISAEREVEDARLALAQHRRGAAGRLRAAERFRDGIRRKVDGLGLAPAPAVSSFGTETLRPDFGTDEDAP